jgi:hypothetical protein
MPTRARAQILNSWIDEPNFQKVTIHKYVNFEYFYFFSGNKYIYMVCRGIHGIFFGKRSWMGIREKPWGVSKLEGP